MNTTTTHSKQAAAIVHDREDRGNKLRQRLAAVEGRGQRTRTPSLAVVSDGEGVELVTVDGRRLVDFASGVLVTNLGHRHPLFEERYRHHLGRCPLSAYNMVTPIEVEASERLLASMAASNPKAEKILWAASGSEGIQKAIWAAMAFQPDRPILAATRHGFHGKKGLAGDVTGEASPNPNVRFVSFPMRDVGDLETYERELTALSLQFSDHIALLITEPYLGAAGSFHPPHWYHELLERWCTEHHIPLIFDEVQSCHGRTGSMYAFETYGVNPDLVVVGKGVANGVPAAAVAGRADLINMLDYGAASDTFSATPMACAAVCATLDVFESEGIVAQCQAIAPVMRRALEELAAAFPFITAVRGEGLVYGLEMQDAATAEACVLEAYRGVNGRGVHFLGPLAERVLRVSPPLIIDEATIHEACELLHTAWSRIGS